LFVHHKSAKDALYCDGYQAPGQNLSEELLLVFLKGGLRAKDGPLRLRRASWIFPFERRRASALAPLGFFLLSAGAPARSRLLDFSF